MTDALNYPQFIDQAMRTVVREILRKVSVSGLPGDHHFYISYSTLHAGVRMSEQLRAKYPKEITIVLQHQFWDFRIEDQQFHVTLSFGGVPEKLTIPFAALTAFADPSVKFGLQFQMTETSDNHEMFSPSGDIAISVVAETQDVTNPAESAEIISLDTFRKK
jgi:hypothetical protein